jgi:hypothetical protein
MKAETKRLIRIRQENVEAISQLSNENNRLTVKMCEIEGICPHCRNWHYPHCGMDLSEDKEE